MVTYERSQAPLTISYDFSEEVLIDFGDGEIITGEAGTYTYSFPGRYVVSANGIANEIVYVEDNLFLEQGLGNNPNRRSYVYGNSLEQGFGWSENGDSGYVWPDSKGSIIQLFDDNEDFHVVSYDSITGLPYAINPRKACIGSRVVDSWLDKYDELTSRGYLIRTRVRLPEYIGSHESFQSVMSDLSLFFNPIYKEKQGVKGYTEDGFRGGTTFDLELYKDDKLNPESDLSAIPLKSEVFFDKKVQAHVLQIAIETSDSQLRMNRIEAFLRSMDKARFPFSDKTTERTLMLELALNTFNFYTPRGLFKDVVNNETVITPNGIGPDGLSTSYILGEDLQLSGVCLVCGKVSLGFDLIGSVNKFNVYYGENILLTNGGEFFEIRSYESLSPAAAAYYLKDLSENKGNNVCRRV